MLACPVTNGVHFYYLVKVVSIKFLYCETTIALFLISMILIGSFFLDSLLFHIRISPTSLASIVILA